MRKMNESEPSMGTPEQASSSCEVYGRLEHEWWRVDEGPPDRDAWRETGQHATYAQAAAQLEQCVTAGAVVMRVVWIRERVQRIARRDNSHERILPDLAPHPEWEIIPCGTALMPGDHVWWSADKHNEMQSALIGRCVNEAGAATLPEGFYRRRKVAASEPHRYEGDGTPPQNTVLDRHCYPLGASVDAAPKDGYFDHAFRGTVVGHSNGMIQVRDQGGDVFDCEPLQLSHAPKEEAE